jgi:peptidoglycan/xylan/chitin deacetylase (PgdA/CDA1 family)
MSMKLRKVFYVLKPFIPRGLQIRARRLLCRAKRARHAQVWPIDPKSGQAPPGWTGWPEGKTFALVLTHDVETAWGQERVRALAEVEMRLGFRSSFNFVPERYAVSAELRRWLSDHGFEVGVHDLRHDGRLFSSRDQFMAGAAAINRVLREWGVRGFRAGAMHHNLEWIGALDIDFDESTFDTDPFEPQPDGMGTIFPFCVPRRSGPAYAELPYTLAQDFTVFVLFAEPTARLWTTKLDWIARQGGMALLNVHPDYIRFPGSPAAPRQYPLARYEEFLQYGLAAHGGNYWNALPSEVAGLTLRGGYPAPPGVVPPPEPGGIS